MNNVHAENWKAGRAIIARNVSGYETLYSIWGVIATLPSSTGLTMSNYLTLNINEPLVVGVAL